MIVQMTLQSMVFTCVLIVHIPIIFIHTLNIIKAFFYALALLIAGPQIRYNDPFLGERMMKCKQQRIVDMLL
jgi:hypothetical protein